MFSESVLKPGHLPWGRLGRTRLGTVASDLGRGVDGVTHVDPDP